jgi:hypothetical protein
MKTGFWAGTVAAVSLSLICQCAALASGSVDPNVTPGQTTQSGVAVAVPGIGAAVADLAVQPALSSLPIDWAALRAVYDAGRMPIWVTANGFTPLGTQFAQLLPKALRAGFGLPPELALAATALTPPGDAASAARIEALMSAIFLAGAVDAGSLLGSGDQRGVAILAALDSAPDQAVFLSKELPAYAPFWRLYRQLPAQVAYLRAGGWPQISGTEKLEPGQRDPRVAVIRQRLLVTGELAAADATVADAEFYDPALEQAVQRFQRAHGLNDDAVIGRRTIEEMNVSAETRLRMVLLNLRRMQEQGPSFAPRHLIVNVPAQEVKIIDEDQVVFYTKAIVGRLDRKTPLLTSIITQVKLNPDWTVPAKIAANDMLRHELDQPGYFATKNVRVYDGDGNEVDPRAIDWREVRKSGYFPYRLKQDAGPENALGPVKLDFKNDYAVYLHGTPTPALFARQDRYLSSGCVRTADPVGLAAFVLKDNPLWTRAHVDEVIASGKTSYVSVARPLPINITYMTAWVDEAGVPQFRQDAYGYDRLPSLPRLAVNASEVSDAAPTMRDRNMGRN